MTGTDSQRTAAEWLRRRSVRWWLALPAVFAFAGMLLVATALTFSLRAQREASLQHLHYVMMLPHIEEIGGKFLELVTSVQGYVLNGDSEVETLYVMERQDLEGELATLRTLVRDPDHLAQTEALGRHFRAWEEEIAEPIMASLREGRPAAYPVERSGILVRAVSGALDRLEASEREVLRERQESEERTRLATLLAMVAGSLIELVLVIASTRWAGRAVVGPLTQLARAARRLGRGDSEARIEVPGAAELGSVADSFNEMAQLLGTERRALRTLNEQLELRVLERTAELESQSERLETVISNVPGLVWEAGWAEDREGLCDGFVSDHLEEMLGYTPEEWRASPRRMASRHPPGRPGEGRRGTPGSSPRRPRVRTTGSTKPASCARTAGSSGPACTCACCATPRARGSDCAA